MSVKPLSKGPNEQTGGDGLRFDSLMRLSLKAKGDTKPKEDRIATDNEKWPPVDKTQVEAAKDGKIRYELNGQGVVVERSVNPELYKFLVNLHTLNQSPGQKAQVVAAMGDEHLIADRNTEVQDWGDYAQFKWQGNLEDAEVITYITADGETVSVSKALTPELFASVQQIGLSRYTLEQRVADGREVAGADTYVAEHDIALWGGPDEFGNGVIQFETKDGKKYVVSQHENKEMYDRVAGMWSDHVKGGDSIQELREKYDLPDLDALDLLGQSSGEKANKDDKDEMTVVELATKNLLDKYKKLIDDGEVGKDSDIYKLVKAIEAKAAMESGHQITPYIEDPRGGDTTWRKFDTDGETLSEEDMQDILNGNSVDKLLSEMFTSGDGEKDKIGKEFQAELDSAIEKVSGEDKTKLADEIYETLTSLDFVRYLADMKKQGLNSEGQAEVARLASSLELLDPERARQAESALKQNGILIEIDTLVGDPGAIPDEYKEMAYKDMGALIKTVLKSADIPRRVQETIEKFYNELLNDKTKMADFVELSNQLNNGTITQAEFDQQMQGKYVPMDVSKDDFAKALGTLNKYGVLGTISAFGSLGGAIYMLSAKNGQLADEPLERLAIAKDFITFLGGGAQFEKTGIFDLFTKTNTAELLGLSKTVPEIWGKESALGKKIEGFLRDKGISGIPEAVQDRANSMIELGSLNSGGGSDALDQVRLSAEASGIGSLDDAGSRALLDDIITRAGGNPPEDWSRYNSLNQIAEEQNLTISEEHINDAIAERRAANGLGDIPDDASVNEFANHLDDAANRALPPSITSSGYSTYTDALSSIYEDAVEYFEERNITPPSRESFDRVVNERLEESGRSTPAGGDPFDGNLELDRQSINEMFEHENRTPPAADVVDDAIERVNASVRSNTSVQGIVDTRTIQDALSTTDTPSIKPGLAAKIGGTLTKVLGVAPDILSVADIVMGGFAIKDAIANNSDLGKAAGALQIISGVAGTTAGVIGTVGLFASIGALAGATGPLFLITAGLGLIAGIIGIFVDHEKKQKATDKEGQWFKDLAELGLTQEDWGDKLEYARYSFYEYDGRDAPAGQSIYDYQKDEWEHFKDTPQEGGSSINRLDDDLHLAKYDRAFYQENREVIHTIRERWDDWNGKDAIVSKKDLEKIANGDGSDEEKAAAQFLLDNNDFFDQLDTQWGKGGQDGKVSTNDLNTWLKMVGAHEEKFDRAFFDEHQSIIDTIRDRWDDWNGKDAIVSKKDLEKIADGDGSDAEKEAARFLLDNQGFFDQLDNLAKNDRRDGKISTGDLETWLKAIGVEKTDKSELTYNPNDNTPAWRVMRG
ncbi:hypothetical protein DNK06_01220 [Pseudomonas daroniae]|uniref:Uncharacterized protein n=1 Tax=Phytopseudomonas daroniae TaxID=2487519 RepID=A0A4Q9QTG6_9GAMM|nr:MULTISPECIES: hypothetical protein [Pseudomonas]TBU76891.1 hypothetical protein DNK31_21970 [Pseudomonas sp. FRB 228]TBU84042.1 hypothetical protein DNK06_01220 [Pseudomonas daroniae]TBU93220.1 hypothetical protein DNJ99_07130 [Pseudomonas daroniae]